MEAEFFIFNCQEECLYIKTKKFHYIAHLPVFCMQLRHPTLCHQFCKLIPYLSLIWIHLTGNHFKLAFLMQFQLFSNNQEMAFSVQCIKSPWFPILCTVPRSSVSSDLSGRSTPASQANRDSREECGPQTTRLIQGSNLFVSLLDSFITQELGTPICHFLSSNHQ